MRAVLPVLIATTLVACGAETPTASDERSALEQHLTLAPTIASRSSFEEQGLKWPLTVEEGQLGCSEMARWIEVGGTRYGLNGLATVDRGYAEVDAIWLIDEEMAAQLDAHGVLNDPPSRISISDMIGEAGKLCGQ